MVHATRTGRNAGDWRRLTFHPALLLTLTAAVIVVIVTTVVVVIAVTVIAFLPGSHQIHGDIIVRHRAG